MAVGGVTAQKLGYGRAPTGPNYSPQNAYAQSIPTQAENYDEIMSGVS